MTNTGSFFNNEMCVTHWKKKKTAHNAPLKLRQPAQEAKQLWNELKRFRKQK